MASGPPHVIESASGRVFATSPAAVVVAIVNPREQLLLLEHPRRSGWWEPVNGAVEAGETLLGAALREVARRWVRTFACALSESSMQRRSPTTHWSSA